MGLEAITVTVEITIDRGVMFHLSGLADTSNKARYDRIKAALTNIGLRMPIAEITVNLSPADRRKGGSGGRRSWCLWYGQSFGCREML